MCREVGNWTLVHDDQAFEHRAYGGSKVRCRLQVLRCSHNELLLIAVQSRLDRCGSAVNLAEFIAEGAIQQALPGYSQPTPPDLFIIQNPEDNKPHTILAKFQPSTDGTLRAESLTASLRSSREWAALVDAHVDGSRGADFIPHPQRRSLSVTGWRILALAEPRDVQPFRTPCLAADRPLTSRLRLRWKQGSDSCCSYHQVNWSAATDLVNQAVTISRTNDQSTVHDALDNLPATDDVATASAAHSLLFDPINVTWREHDIVNGQHRIAAMRDQGVVTVWAQCSVPREDRDEFVRETGGWIESEDLDGAL